MDGYGSSKPIPKQDGQEEGQDKYQLGQELAQVLREAEETEREEQAREKEESPDWDGSEAEYVPDDDAEEYEELSPGIGLNYVLRPEEVYECLKHSGFCKTSGKRAMVECVILGICAVMCMAAYFTKTQAFSAEAARAGYLAAFFTKMYRPLAAPKPRTIFGRACSSIPAWRLSLPRAR